MQGGGGHILNLLFFKRKIVRLGSKMDHISATLAFGQRNKKTFGGTKSSKGLETGTKIGGGRQKNQQGAPNGNVTPLIIVGVVITNHLHFILPVHSG